MSAYAHSKLAAPDFIFRRSFTNSQYIIADLLEDIRMWMEQINVHNGTITNVQITLAEALNNIIEHGFDGRDNGEIELEIKSANGTTVVHLADNGVEFTPPNNTRTPLQDNADIDSLPEGGFGWFLISEITSSYTFHRKGNKNHLLLKF
jgi:serine/threonine-protein kinase RsbW